MLGVNLALSIASKFTGYTPVFLKPDWIFTTVIAWFLAGEKTSQKRLLGKHFALVSKFHWLKYLCHSFLNWAKGVESSICTMWLVIHVYSSLSLNQRRPHYTCGFCGNLQSRDEACLEFCEFLNILQTMHHIHEISVLLYILWKLQ